MYVSHIYRKTCIIYLLLFFLSLLLSGYKPFFTGSHPNKILQEKCVTARAGEKERERVCSVNHRIAGNFGGGNVGEFGILIIAICQNKLCQSSKV